PCTPDVGGDAPMSMRRIATGLLVLNPDVCATSVLPNWVQGSAFATHRPEARGCATPPGPGRRRAPTVTRLLDTWGESFKGGRSMTNCILKAAGCAAMTTFAVALAVTVVSVTPSDARAGEAEAKSLLKGMSDYLAAQKSISFAFDTNLEVVTKDQQK